MYTNDVVRRVAKRTRLSQSLVSEVLSTALKQVSAALAEGEVVQLIGFGSFYTRERAESEARDFRTGELVTVPAMRQAAFRPGQLLKKAVRRKKVSTAEELEEQGEQAVEKAA